MTHHNPRTLSELENTLAHAWSFSSSTFGLQGHTALVLSSTKHLTPGDPFTDLVIESQNAYTARYTASGDRTRLSSEVLYYLTAGARVVAYVTAGGEYAIDNASFTPRQLRAVHAGIVRTVSRILLVWGDEIEAQIAGCCPAYPNCGH